MEQKVRCTRKFEKFDSLFEVDLVGVLVFGDRLADPLLLPAPLRGLLVEELLRDPPVELVDVSRASWAGQSIPVDRQRDERVYNEIATLSVFSVMAERITNLLKLMDEALRQSGNVTIGFIITLMGLDTHRLYPTVRFARASSLRREPRVASSIVADS